ncbi:MAG: ComEC/Rec2 family competence protein [Planctomycetaceae bacterium]|nr:ComEC/Rec2 family competence protein [Planctomycetaceae bacterium]
MTVESTPVAGQLARDPHATALRYHPLVLVLAAICAGIMLDRAVSGAGGRSGVGIWLVLSAIASAAWLVCHSRSSDQLASFALLCAIACVSGAWHHGQWYLFAADEIALVASPEMEPTCLEVVAQHAPRFLPPPKFDPLNPMVRGAQSRFTARVTALRDGVTWRAASGRITVRVDGHVLGVSAGDRLRLSGQLVAATPPLNPGEFDFAAHQRADRVLSHVWIDHPAGVKRLASGMPDRWLSWFDGSRLRAQQVLHHYLQGDTRDLADALILGQREQLSYAQNDAYFRSGMIHLLSVSGVHVAVLALGLLWALRLGYLRRGTALIGVAVLTGLYALLIDAEPPAIRATIIVVLSCWALRRGRDARPFNALAGAAIVVLVMNPADLMRAGPQLSFLAAAVLAYLARFELQRVERDPLDVLIASTRPWPIRVLQQLAQAFGQAMLVSIVIWILSLPLIVHNFHIATPVALLLTPLLAVPIAITLFSGFGLLAAGILFPPVAPALAWCFEQSVALIEATIRWGLAVPGNHQWLPGASLWIVLLFYGLVLVMPLAAAWQRRRRMNFALVGFASLLTLVTPQMLKPGMNGELRCTFLAVGHGCAVLVELPSEHKLLYDAGHLGPPIYGAQSIASALFSRQIQQLDSIVISHADVDHYNAVPELLERFDVKQVWLTSKFRADNSAPTRILLHALQQHRVPSADLAAGDRFWLDAQCSLRVLHPPSEGVAGSDNANSIVLLIEYLGRRILLTGDLEGFGLERLLKGPRLDVDVLLAPHHGSTRSNPPGCATWCSPEYVVISGGPDAQPQVREAYEHAGARVLHTAETGAVTVRINDQGVHVSTYRGGKLP